MRFYSHALRLAVAGFAALFLAGAAHANLIANLNEFTGTDATVDVMAEQVGTDIKFTVTVTNPLGDIRGVFFHIGDEGLLPGLSVTGTDITANQFGPANTIINFDGGNMNGGGTPCPCDFAVAIGTPGVGSDDIMSTMFTLTHSMDPLALSQFLGQAVGVRITSVGPAGARDGSSKLTGTFVPEPSTALMLSVGLLGLARTGRKRSR